MNEVGADGSSEPIATGVTSKTAGMVEFSGVAPGNYTASFATENLVPKPGYQLWVYAIDHDKFVSALCEAPAKHCDLVVAARKGDGSTLEFAINEHPVQ